MDRLEPLPLPERPTFSDLVFRPHPDGILGHTQALHAWPSEMGFVSITRGGCNYGTTEAPYEMMGPDGDIHAPLTEEGVTQVLASYTK